GMPVSGASGRIALPPNASKINLAADGTLSADGAPIGSLRLVAFPDASVLTPVGTTLFEGPAENAVVATDPKVVQGYRESSNVKRMNEMVQMIIGMRQYEAVATSLRAVSDAVQQRTRGQD